MWTMWIAHDAIADSEPTRAVVQCAIEGTASVSDVTVLLIVGIHKLFSGVESTLSLMDGRTVKMPGVGTA